MTTPTPGAAGHAADISIAPPRLDDALMLAVSLAVEDLIVRLVAAREAERDAEAGQTGPRRLRFCGWVLDLHERRLVAPGGGVLLLPRVEYTLLRAFAGHPRQVLRREYLVQLIRRDGSDYPSARTMSVYISRLRRRLSRSGSAPLISTVWRTGYVFDADVVRT